MNKFYNILSEEHIETLDFVEKQEVNFTTTNKEDSAKLGVEEHLPNNVIQKTKSKGRP